MSKLYDVFISHSSEDKKLALDMAHYLEARKISCWIATRDIQAGKDYAQSIVEAIKLSSLMVVIISRFANNSQHVRNEVERAFNHKLTIIPFRIENIIPSQSLEYFLSSTHWLDAFAGKPEHYFETLYKNCSSQLDKEAEPTPAIIKKDTRPRSKKRFLLLASLVLVLVLISVYLANQNKRRNSTTADTIPDSTKNISSAVIKDSIAIPGNNKENSVKPDGKIPETPIPPAPGNAATSTHTKELVNKQPVQNTTTEWEFLNGGLYKQSSSTDNLRFTAVPGAPIHFDGKIAGYQVSGILTPSKNRVLPVQQGNVSGELIISADGDHITGKLTIKESMLLYDKINLVRSN